MRLPRFDFHEPASIGEACEILATYGPKAKLMAGGTDLMVNMKKKILAPDHVVSLSKIVSMQGMEEKDGRILIGARFTVAELTVDSLVGKKLHKPKAKRASELQRPKVEAKLSKKDKASSKIRAKKKKASQPTTMNSTKSGNSNG